MLRVLNLATNANLLDSAKFSAFQV
jgi:hypothetical protein